MFYSQRPVRDWLVVFLHLGQLITACGVIFYYARDYVAPNKRAKYEASSWIFAFSLGGISGLTALIYIIFRWQQRHLHVMGRLIWDAILFLCWGTVLAIFGSKYLNGQSDKVMRVACYWDAASFVFCFASLAISIKGWRQAKRFA